MNTTFQTITFEYKKSEHYWIARYNDGLGQLGPIASGRTKERAAFELGLLRGQHPVAFTRRLEEFFKGETV
jgi:hypothetical protein